MRALLLSLLLTILLTLALTMSAAASYTDPFGATYTDAQWSQFCAALRPGSATHRATFDPPPASRLACRALLLSLLLTILLTLALTMSAAASYTDPFGATYTDAQWSQFCAALRPGSAAWVRYDCSNH